MGTTKVVRKRHNFRELKVWQRARVFVATVYTVSKAFPKEELFSLTQQIRRCVISIPSNIAEGCGRGTDAQLIHFLDVAHGSACELETQLFLAFDLKYFDEIVLNKAISEIHEIQKMILDFQSTLQ